MGGGVDHGRNFGEAVGDDVRQVLVPVYPRYRNQIPFPGDGVDLTDAFDGGDFLRGLGNAGGVSLDQNKCGNHVCTPSISSAAARHGRFVSPASLLHRGSFPGSHLVPAGPSLPAAEPDGGGQQEPVPHKEHGQGQCGHDDEGKHYRLGGQRPQEHADDQAAKPYGNPGMEDR
jgi:hypothetical protein